MKFSLIIPTKGRGEQLGRAIEALFAQTCPDFEVIVSDQNEDDRVARLLAEKGWTERVRVVKSSGGISAAKNAGIDAAAGTILGFPDDDCLYPPDLLDRVQNFFALHPECHILSGRSIADDGGDAASRHDRQAGPIRRSTIHRQLMEFALWIRRDALGPLRFDEQMGVGSPTPWQADEGPDLILRLAARGVAAFYDPAFAVWHPRPTRVGPRAVDRAYGYACGTGFFLRKHRYPASSFLTFAGRSLAGAALSLLRFRFAAARTYLARVRGLWRGWHEFPGSPPCA